MNEFLEDCNFRTSKCSSYRRILRKEKEAADKKQLEQLQQTDPDAFLERMEQLEEARMEVRARFGGGQGFVCKKEEDFWVV